MRRSSILFFGLFLAMILLSVLFLRVPAVPPRSRIPSGITQSSASSDIAPSHVTVNLAYVVRAVDGDTLFVRMGDNREERVRFIGIDAPESVDPKRSVGCYGFEASKRMHELLDGKDIELTPEPQADRDVFGRLLRYVSFGGIDIGAEMIREGYTESYCYKYPHARCSQYESLERTAATKKVGMWGACR